MRGARRPSVVLVPSTVTSSPLYSEKLRTEPAATRWPRKGVVSDKPPTTALVALAGFVDHARVDGGGQQVVGSRDGVNVTGEVEVEILHRDHLAVAAACGAALDA